MDRTSLEQIDDGILRWLATLSGEWRAFDSLEVPATELTALHCCVQTGLVELQIPSYAWESDPAGRMRATFFVTGGWEPRDLITRLCAHVRSWNREEVTVQPEPRQYARLTAQGRQAQADISEPGLWRLTAVLAAQANRQPARVRCRIDDFAPANSTPAPMTPPLREQGVHDAASTGKPNAVRGNGPSPGRPKSPPGPNKTERIREWLSRYLDDHRLSYEELMPSVLAGDRQAQRRFQEIFGLSTLAELFTQADGTSGDDGQQSSNKTMISRSDLYQSKVKPLLNGEPPLDERELRRRKIDEDLESAGR